MTILAPEVLGLNVTFVGVELLRGDSEIAACSAALGTEIVPEGFVLAGSPDQAASQGRVLRLPRDRIVVEPIAGRTRITREYPDSVEDIPRIAEFMQKAIEATQLQERLPSAFGFNIQLVYDQDSGDSAMRYLGRRLFRSPGPFPKQWALLGGHGKLVFQDPPFQWTVTFEPRLVLEATKVFLDMNLHIGQSSFPSTEEAGEHMRTLWERARALAESIDRSLL